MARTGKWIYVANRNALYQLKQGHNVHNILLLKCQIKSCKLTYSFEDAQSFLTWYRIVLLECGVVLKRRCISAKRLTVLLQFLCVLRLWAISLLSVEKDHTNWVTWSTQQGANTAKQQKHKEKTSIIMSAATQRRDLVKMFSLFAVEVRNILHIKTAWLPDGKMIDTQGLYLLSKQ